MRKFKIKNKQKRKYTKKIIITPSYIYKSTAMSIIPALLSIITVGTIFLLSQIYLYRLNLDIIFSLPPNSSQISIPKYTLPRIDFETIYQIIFMCLKTSLDLFQLLNPDPLSKTIQAKIFSSLLNSFQIIQNIFLITFDYIIDVIKYSIIGFKKFVNHTENTLDLIILWGFKKISVITGVTYDMLLYISEKADALASLIYEIILKILIQIYGYLLETAITIKNTILRFISQIFEFTNRIFTIIKSPFIKLTKNVRALAPVADKITEILGSSATGLIKNMADIFKFILKNT